MRSIWCRRACCVLSVCAGTGLSLVYSPAVDGMSGVPGEDGLVLDELGRERLTEGRQLLAALLGEHDRMQQNIRKGPLPGDIDREALEGDDGGEPAAHFSSCVIRQVHCWLFA